MKKQLLYRSPDINEYGGGDDEQQPVDEKSADAGEETGPEDGATDEDNTDTADENSTEDSATDEDTTSGEETGSEGGATDEDNTDTTDESSTEDGATDEDTTSGEEANSEDGATDEDNTDTTDENSSEDGATDEETTSGEETSSEDGATDEDNTDTTDESSTEDGATDEDTTSGEEANSEGGATDEDNTDTTDENSTEDSATDEETTSGEETSSEDGATDEDNTNIADENSSEDGATDGSNTEEGETSTNEEETPKEGNTEEGETSSNEEETPKEDNTEEGETSSNEEETPKEGNTEEGETLSNEEETPKEGNTEEKEPLVEEEFPKNNAGGQQSSNEEEPPKENNPVSAPPVAVVWPGNLSQTPVTTPGDELATFIAAIKTNRANVPEHLTDKNKVKNGYMYDPFSGKPQPQPASIQPDTVDAWIWEELRSEGSYTSINTYDNMIVTWGRGVAGANIAKVLKSVFSAHSDIQTEFNNVGIGLNANGILQVVDTTQNCVKEASFALQTIKADKKLLDFLVDISLNDKYKEVFLDAQWNFVKTFNSTLFAYVNASKWSKDAVQLMFHFNWWLPAYAWNGHPQTYKDTAGDVHKIIYIFAGNLNKNSVLVVYLKKFAGNAFSKYVAKPEYETQPAGEHIVFEDGGKTYYFPKL